MHFTVPTSTLGRMLSVAGGCALLLTTSCAQHTVAKAAKAPAFESKGQTKCSVSKSQNKPLVVEWASAERGDLEARSRSGLVVVSYDGCELNLLNSCLVEDGSYSYTAFTPKKDVIHMKNADDLYANIPVGAAKFEAKLEQSGELGVDMTLVGTYRADRIEVDSEELTGSCDGATHVVSGLTVGAFEFFAGGKASAGAGANIAGAGAGAKSAATRETLTRDGKNNACKSATRENEEPPVGCSALIRIEVLPLKGVEQNKTARVASLIAAATNPLGDAAPGNPSPGPPAPPAPAPPPPDTGGLSAVSPIAWAGFGVGAVGLIGGAITGGMALGTASDLEAACGPGGQQCPESKREDHDSALVMADVATAGFVIGGVGAAVGAAGLLFFSGSFEASANIKVGESTQLEPQLGLGTVGVRGHF